MVSQKKRHHAMSSSNINRFSADRTARSMIGYWHDDVVCLSVCLSVLPSVTLCIVANR